LHDSLDDINRGVCEDWSSTGNTTTDESSANFVHVKGTSKNSFGILVDKESDTLIRSLLQDSWEKTLVESRETLLSSNRSDTINHTLVFRGIKELIMDEFDFESLSWGNNYKGFSDTSTQTSHECVQTVLWLWTNWKKKKSKETIRIIEMPNNLFAIFLLQWRRCSWGTHWIRNGQLS